MVRSRLQRLGAAVLCIAMVVVAAGCSPGSSPKSSTTADREERAIVTDPAKMGKVTITEWDKNVIAVPSRAQNALNREFHRRYPNITIKRVAKEFNDLKTTLKLALSSSKPPDVAQINQGYPDLAALAKAGLLLPLDSYAKRYNWTGLYQPALLAQNRATPEGAWGRGNLYGISNTGEVVGVFYNKALLAKVGLRPPTTLAEFTAALPKIKAAGLLPIQYGASDKGPAIHLLGLVQANLAGPKGLSNLVFGGGNVSWRDRPNIESLNVIADWAKQGFISKDANGQSGYQAAANFGKGQGVFFISGSWWTGDLQKAMGKNVGFAVLAPQAGAKPVTMGGFGLAWGVAAKSKHPDAAAAYVNFLNSPYAADVVARTGDIPSVPTDKYAPAAGSLQADMFGALKSVLRSGGLVPYLDYSTPDFYDVVTSQIQQVTSGRTTPDQAASRLENEVKNFHASR